MTLFLSRLLDDLPQPDQAARDHVDQVLQGLRAVMQSKTIGFDQYMHYVLYQPGLGYYSTDNEQFGQAGDFMTAPLLSKWFSISLANYLARHIKPGDDILEIGAGSGVMAGDILHTLYKKKCLPDHYYILEVSGHLRQRQRQWIEQRFPQYINRVIWLDHLPGSGCFRGLIIGNEVIDSMPVKRFALVQGDIDEIGVSQVAGQLVWRCMQAKRVWKKMLLARLNGDIGDYPDNYQLAVNGRLGTWIKGLADCLDCGQILMIDYGFERCHYYSTQRSGDTVRGYYRHHVVDDVLQWPGLLDITASVDFTAVAEAAHRAGLAVIGYTTQANFLIDQGILDCIHPPKTNAVDLNYLREVQRLKYLLEPDEMGEMMKVIVLSKGEHKGLEFSRDQRHRL